jgi:hypothetical protein
VQESERALAAAAEAMLGAQQQLEALQTGPALPHQMTALNELMRAQSDVRQREVQRQQAGSGGGGRAANRQQQDLSSLFDRELARMQQTNYEASRATSEARGGGSDPDLEKVRELARRQEELNQRQRDLAAQQLPDDERRRELERLTREQSELRQQVEELARSVQGLQQASDEMRAATSGMRRRDTNEAAASGRRALERLQQVEQQMRGSPGPQASRSAGLGELQLEARQIAEAQRRLSEGNDPARGLGPAKSGEQDRLADRMQRLEDAVRQQARAGAAGQGESSNQALREAARELDRQRLSERMRDAARSPSGSAGERVAIAREVDRLSERLGNATGDSPEARQLGEQLSRLTDLRERLSALEGQGDTPQSAGEIRQLVEDLRREGSLGLSPGELRELNPGRSAPGTEAWKQDFRRWDALKAQVAAALQQAEAAAAARLRAQQVNDRLQAGVAQSVPEQYRRLVERYYRALATRGR